jgi:hypothetical protein
MVEWVAAGERKVEALTVAPLVQRLYLARCRGIAQTIFCVEVWQRILGVGVLYCDGEAKIRLRGELKVHR